MFQPNDFQIRSSVRYVPRPRHRWLDHLVGIAVFLACLLIVGLVLAVVALKILTVI